jgi:hypothetical protein
LEVNPNPDFSPLAGLSGGLTSAGMTHSQFTIELVQAALLRGLEAGHLKAEVKPAKKQRKKAKEA